VERTFREDFQGKDAASGQGEHGGGEGSGRHDATATRSNPPMPDYLKQVIEEMK
jgi:hypothetical protein